MIRKRPRSVWTRGPRRARGWWAVALAFVAALGAAPADGRAPVQPAPQVAGADSLRIVESLPDDVVIVVRIVDAERQLRSAPGQSIAKALVGAKLFSETRAAWDTLAARLGWEPGEAFRRLAGRRLVVAVAGQTPGGERAWAVLSDVDAGAERSLRRVLVAAPRQTVAGQPILSLDDGRFELAVVCVGGGAGAGPDAASRTIVLSPTGRGDLLDRIITGLRGTPAGPILGDSAAMADARRMAEGDVFVLVRRQPKAGPEHLAISAMLAGDGWDATLRASAGMLAGEHAQAADAPEGVTPWSADAVEELAPRAIALVMSEGLPGLGRWAPLLMVPTLPEAGDRLGGLLGGRTFLGVFRTGDGDGGGTGGAALTLGFETPDTAALAAPADAVIARLVGQIEAGANAGEKDRPDFQGYLPGAPRVVPLTGPAVLPWTPVLGTRPQLTWVFGPDGQGGAPWAGAVQAGWWLMALAPSDGPVPIPAWVMGVCRRLGDPGPEADRRPRVSVGSVRVGEAVRWLADLHADPTGVLAPLGCIQAIRWDTWLTPDGRAEGTIRVTTTPTP